MNLRSPEAVSVEEKEQRPRNQVTFAQVAEASVSCDIVNKSFNLSETHMVKGIMIPQGCYESLRVSNFLSLFYLIFKMKK